MDQMKVRTLEERWNRITVVNRLVPNKENVGGHSTDISQIGRTLYGALREKYPINKVPEDLAVRVEALIKSLEEVELEILELIVDASQDLDDKPKGKKKW